MELIFIRDNEEIRRRVTIRQAIVAGWTGKDKDALDAHITEMRKKGIPAPTETPMFYRVSPQLLTTESHIQVVGRHSTGEVEAVVLSLEDGDWVGLGSDHTDRDVQRRSTALSKQLCPKPIAATCWSLEDVGDHWDALELRSYVTVDGEEAPYQAGDIEVNLSYRELKALYEERHGAIVPGTAMFCGTVAALRPVTFSTSFRMEMIDTARQRRIDHAYTIEDLPLPDPLDDGES